MAVAPKDAEGKAADLTHGQRLQKDDKPFDFPEAPAYLVGWLDALGWYARGAMAMAPLSAQEIAAWSAGTGHRLAPWEFEVIHAASAAFVSEYHAENPTPPDVEPDEQPKPSLMGVFKNLAKKVNKEP